MDTEFCLKQGVIGQETTGAAGFAKALRTIPVVLDLCEKIEALAPDSFLINFTNPAGIITESVSKYTRVKVIGLCNISLNMKMDIADMYSVLPEEVFLDYVGLNHLSWVRKVYVKGRDVSREVKDKFDYNPANNPAD